MLLNVFIL